MPDKKLPPPDCPECGHGDIETELQFDENDDPACLKHTCRKCGHIYRTNEGNV